MMRQRRDNMRISRHDNGNLGVFAQLMFSRENQDVLAPYINAARPSGALDIIASIFICANAVDDDSPGAFAPRAAGPPAAAFLRPPGPAAPPGLRRGHPRRRSRQYPAGACPSG